MSASGIRELGDLLRGAVGGFRPQNRQQVDEFFRVLPELMTVTALSLLRAAMNMDEGGHIHEQVIEATCELADNLMSTVSTAESVLTQHLIQHRIWLD